MKSSVLINQIGTILTVGNASQLEVILVVLGEEQRCY